MTNTLNKNTESCTGSDTPETNAARVTKDSRSVTGNHVATDFARKLERERNQWKAAHDNQVELKRIICDRPDLKERATLVARLVAERDEWKAFAVELEKSRDSLLRQLQEDGTIEYGN